MKTTTERPTLTPEARATRIDALARAAVEHDLGGRMSEAAWAEHRDTETGAEDLAWAREILDAMSVYAPEESAAAPRILDADDVLAIQEAHRAHFSHQRFLGASARAAQRTALVLSLRQAGVIVEGVEEPLKRRAEMWEDEK